MSDYDELAEIVEALFERVEKLEEHAGIDADADPDVTVALGDARRAFLAKRRKGGGDAS